MNSGVTKPFRRIFIVIDFQESQKRVGCEGACAHAHVRCAIACVRVCAKSILKRALYDVYYNQYYKRPMYLGLGFFISFLPYHQ